MTQYKARALVTDYWRPEKDYLKAISLAVKECILDGDFLVISEKALSVATDNIVDENCAVPDLNARILARFWMRIVWGYFLGSLCGFRLSLIRNLRAYPILSGGQHKHVVIQHVAPLQALMFGSEGGIDGSNLPYSFVSLPLENPQILASQIQRHIAIDLNKKVNVLIVDTDKTFSFLNFHFSPRSTQIEGIKVLNGVIPYLCGRLFKLKKRATPIAAVGRPLSAEQALTIAQIADKARGEGAGETVWIMAQRFRVGLTEVSWEMLDTVRHKPIVIVRQKKR